ncbi:TauD/TfdA family dioxygenase [Dyella tabacisoli]|nr:TauD/TfdA family dioxygenase [Dyella tabacisoli]
MRVDENLMPPVIKAAFGRRSLPEFLQAQREELEAQLVESGALLFRGFGVYDVEGFERAMDAFSPSRLDYVYRSSPRTAVGTRVFTATEYPPQQTIGLHNENAFQRSWPRKIAFCCLRPASHGGETPIADMRKVTRRIGDRIVDQFEARKVRYVRHYHPHVDLPWQTVFQVSDRESLAAFCASHEIACEWLDAETLRTEQVCQGTARHPVTSERIWFNQAHMFHASNLGAEAESSLAACFGRDRLPRQAYYGDGGEIAVEDLDEVRAAFEAEAMAFRWQAGDVLLLDNMLTAHGRRPFKGERRVITALLDPSPGVPAPEPAEPH